MNAPNPALPTRPLPLKPKWIAAGFLLLVMYLLMRPWLVERFGLDLPGFTDVKPKLEAPAEDSSKASAPQKNKNRPIEVPVIPEQSEPVVPDESVAQAETPVAAPTGKPPRPENNGAAAKPPVQTPPQISKNSGQTSSGTLAKSTPKPPVVKPTTPPTIAKNTPSPAKPTRPTPAAPAVEPEKPKLGVLKSIGRNTFESTAGLVYSQYRIDHVMEHARDIPDKPTHGVFDGTKDEIFALIDEAYELAQKRGPPQVVIQDEGDRTTYTVNLNRKIGRGGGQSGARRRNPPLKMVKIVLEGNEVVTAFPTDR